MTRSRSQLGLFGKEVVTSVRPVQDDEARALGERLPARLRMGTSSWTFPGWRGLVYAGEPSQQDLVRDGLYAYARHPLFRTVGIDRSYYAPVSDSELEEYAKQLPEDFVAVTKVWSEITTLRFPAHARYGARAGQDNPRFLDAAAAKEIVVDPWTAKMGAHAGPVIFEFPPSVGSGMDARVFSQALDGFLSALPHGPRYAVEIRSRALFTPRYLDVLRSHGVAHAICFWSDMPSIREQLAIDGIFTAPFVVSRLLLAAGASYEERAAAFSPFDRLVLPQPQMREDAVAMWQRAADSDRDTFIIVNNKAEGSSPLTVRGIAELIASRSSR